MTYKTFISYSHSADDKLAPALQSALHRFAKPFYRLRAMRVFRDKTSLHLTPELWPLIQKALAESEYFLLLCSPDAAKSHWVQAEVSEWLKLRNSSADKILLVLTEGEIVWDDAASDFDWNRTNALPANLRGVFRREPLYSDLRWARKATDLSLRNPQFLDEVGSLGATLHGRPKDEMIGNDVRQHRLFKSVAAAAVVILLALTAVASGMAFYAVRQRNEAQLQRNEAQLQTAEAQRQKAEAERQRQSAIEAADRERKAAENERVARENEEHERKKAEQATRNEKTAKEQAEERRREAERQRQIADERRQEAERERSIATSRELAASADSQLTSDPELSVLLSLQAHERTPTAEAEVALRRSLLRSRVRATFKTLNWYKVTYSPDGKWFVLVTSMAQVIEPGTWRVVAELKGPERWSSVRSAKFSRDGKLLLTISYSSDDKRATVRVWEAGSWRIANEFQFETIDSLTDATFSPDGKLVATWSILKERPRLWNLATHQPVALGDQEARVREIIFGPDSKTVAALVDAGTGNLKTSVWGVTTGRLLSENECRVAREGGTAFSPDGKYLALLCWKGTPQVIEVQTGKVVAELSRHGAYPTSLAFSPDGKWLVTAGYDRTARVWETGAWQAAAVLRGHTGSVEGVKFSGDGRVLVTMSHDSTARVWEVGTWRALSVLQGHTRPLYDLGVSPDGRYVVTTSTDSTARVWDVDTGGDVTEIDGASENGIPNELPKVFSPDAKLVVTRNVEGVVEVWEPSTGRRVVELGRGSFLGFSPDGKYVLMTSNLPQRGEPHNMLMWEVRTWQKVAELNGHTDVIRDIAFSPDGRLAVTTGGELRVWEMGTGRSVAVMNDPAWKIDFSPDGKWIGTARSDKTAHIWEVGTWREAAVLRGHEAWVRAIAFSPDGSRLLTAGEDKTARLWEVGTWRDLAVLEGHADRVDEVAFSPDGKYVLTASWDKTARLWDAETGKAVAVMEGHTGSLGSASFSADGRLIVTAGDQTVRVWDGVTGKAITVLQVVTTGLDSANSQLVVRAASFSPDGRFLLTASSDSTTRIYTWEMFAPLEDLLTLARTRITRELTVEEKERYLHQIAVKEDGRPE